MQTIKIRLKRAQLNLGEIHTLTDHGFYQLVFDCIDENGEEFTARMRLHVTEPLDHLVFADPRMFADDGYAVNSVGSLRLPRRDSYRTTQASSVVGEGTLADVRLYEITTDDIKVALLDGYVFPRDHVLQPGASIALTCHDPSIIGGGNAIMFRFINWLDQLGIPVTVYSCGSVPSWARVPARFRCFSNYADMFVAIQEEIVILYSMWHIEPMLRANPGGKKIYHLRQIAEPFHYGEDAPSMFEDKPVINLLESLPIGTLTISPHLQDHYRRKLGVDSLLITNGVDLQEFRPGEPGQRVNGVKRIASVGDPHHFVKGADVLVRALIQLARRHPQTKYQWLVASGNHRPVDLSLLEGVGNVEVIQRSKLSRAQMREFYAGADVVVNPALYEGFGLPTLEAMACGIPVVQADNRGLDFIVAHDRDCLVVPINQPEAMANAIDSILGDENLRQRLRDQALATVQKYSVLQQFESFVDSFSQVLGRDFPEVDVSRIRGVLQSAERFAFKGGMPLVSVVIPSYNQAQYLVQAFESLFAQTYPHWEAVVVNDGSTDNTAEVMADFAGKDARIRPFTKPNGGITSALNYGLEQARGDFFCWLSSDDLFYPTKLELQIKAFEQLPEEYALVYGGFDILQEETGKIDVQPHTPPITLGAEFPEALKFDFIDGCTIMIRMEVMRQVGGFNPYYRHSQDMELWVRLGSRGYRFHTLPEQKLTIRRVHLAQSSTGNMIHCRYDAMWMVHYCLEHFHLLEFYRYFDLEKPAELDRFIEHFVGRMLHTEANVNHPLLQEKFWDWFDHGLAALPLRLQLKILRKTLHQLVRHRSSTAKMEYYIQACHASLSKPRTQQPVDLDFSVFGKDLRQDDRYHDPIGQALFDYATDLMINTHTPLFAQELYFHNTHKVVDTPFRLGHSAIRYLSQFANQFQEVVRPFSALSMIPLTQEEALRQYCSLRFGDLARVFHRSIEFDAAQLVDETCLQQMEADLAELATVADDLYATCSRHPTQPLLYYWAGLVDAAAGKFGNAVQTGFRSFSAGPAGCDWRIAYAVGRWAEHAGDDGRALLAYQWACVRQPQADFVVQAAQRVSGSLGSGRHDLPVPKPFIEQVRQSSLKEASLLDCTIVPALDGTFELGLTAQATDGRQTSVTGRFDYLQEIGEFPIAFAAGDKLSATTQVITPSILLDHLAAGYDFTEASKSYASELAKHAAPRVAFTLLSSSILGGGPAILLRYAHWLIELGVEVAIYSNDTPPAWADLGGVIFHHLPDDVERYRAITEPVVIVYSIFELVHLLRHGDMAGKCVYHLCQGVEDFNYHGADYPSLIAPKPIFQILNSIPVARLGVSPHVQKHFRDEYKQGVGRIINGIDLGLYRSRGIRPMNPDYIRVMIVGNPNRLLKGAEDVKSALRLLANRHPEWHFHLMIVSGQQIAQADAERNVEGFGVSVYVQQTQSQMRDLYRSADIFINPAWYEGFGLPTLEAMACGVPVVQVDNRGLDDVILHGRDCLVVPPQNPQSMADSIEQVVLSRPLRESLLENGFNTAAEYSLSTQFHEFVEVFEDVLKLPFDGFQVQSVARKLRQAPMQKILADESEFSTPLFSVLVPTYNQAHFLPDALESLLAQTYQNWEAIVVNDGSTDETANVLAEYAKRDHRIRVFHKRNGGVGSALNEALRHAHGQWICWLSSDDKFLPNKLDVHLKAIEEYPDIHFFHTNFYLLEEETGRLMAPAYDPEEAIPAREFQVLKFFFDNYINGISVAINRELFEECGFFDERLRYGQDFAMWLKLHARHPSLYLRDVTCVTRLHPGQDTRNFTEAGILDSASACLDFLNEHGFAALFPNWELTDFQNALNACVQSMRLVTDKASFLSKSGFSAALVDRLREWLATNVTGDLRDRLRPSIVSEAENLLKGELTHELAVALHGLGQSYGRSFKYKPREREACLQQQRKWLLKNKEDDQAAAIEKYLALLQRIRAQHREGDAGTAVMPFRKLRILLVAHSFLPYHYGGVEVYAANLAGCLKAEGHEIFVFHPLPDRNAHVTTLEEQKFEGIPVWVLRTPVNETLETQLRNPAIEQLFHKFLEAGKFDVVHFQHTLSLPFSLVEIAESKGVLVNYTFHDFWAICPRVTLYITEERRLCEGPESADKCAHCLARLAGVADDLQQVNAIRANLAFRRDYVHSLMSKVYWLTAPSGYVAEKLGQFGLGDGRIAVASLGIQPLNAGVRHRDGSPLTFGFLGNVHPLKNADLLAQAFSAVNGNARLVYFGGGLPDELEKLQCYADTDTRIGLRGRYTPEQLPQIFAEIDVLVSPSATESFGLAAREALSAGVPLVASDVGGVAEIVSVGENGYLFPSGDVQALAALLQKLVDHPDQVRQLKPTASQIKSMETDGHEWSLRYLEHLAERNQGVTEGGERQASETSFLLEPLNISNEGGYEYQSWLNARTLKKPDARLFDSRIKQWSRQPTFLVMLVLPPGEETLLVQSIQSFSRQFYDNLIVRVLSSSPAPEGFAGERLGWMQTNGAVVYPYVNYLAANTNADWVCLLNAGDLVATHALLMFAEAIHSHPEWRLIYSDHDLVDPDGLHHKPAFKPDFSLDFLRCGNYIGSSMIIRCDLLVELGGYSEAGDGAEHYDFILRSYERLGVHGIGHVADVLVSHPVAKLGVTPLAAGAQRLVDHLGRLGLYADIQHGMAPDSYRVIYRYEGEPLVSVIVSCSHDLVVLQQCVESIVGNAMYGNYEILLPDDGHRDDDTAAYLDGIRSLNERRLRVISVAGGDAVIRDLLTHEAQGEYLLFLSDGLRAAHPEWLASMMNYARLPEVGIVGARILAANGSILHAGTLLGVDGPAGSPFRGLPADHPGYLARAHTDQNYSAVSGDCLLIGKSDLLAAGGWQCSDAFGEYADVDLCLRVRGRGRRIVWTPYTVMLQMQDDACTDKAADDFTPAAEAMYRAWLPEIAADPAYNRNLTTRGVRYEIFDDNTATWDPIAWHPLKRVLIQSGDYEGSGEYRVHAPMRALYREGLAECRTSDVIYNPVEFERIHPDSVILQRQITENQIRSIEAISKFSKAFKVFEIDDLITNVPHKSQHRDNFKPDTVKRLRKAITLCDRLVVSTEPLAQAYRSMASDVKVVPNYIERAKWEGLSTFMRPSRRPRVGWAGGSSHAGDLLVIADVIKELAGEVDWVFFGMCPDPIRKFVAEFHAPVSIDQYPAKLASLNLHLAIAPLELNPFNESKSHLKLLEYGMLGCPVVCTDITPYQGDYPVTRVRNRHAEWVKAIRGHVNDLNACATEGDALRKYVDRHWMLEDHLDVWINAWLP